MVVLESNRTGRIFTILFISGFLYFQGGLLWSSQFIDRDKKKEKRKTTREKQKNKAKQKLVISNAYLWPCNTARERDRDSEKTRTFFPLFFTSPIKARDNSRRRCTDVCSPCSAVVRPKSSPFFARLVVGGLYGKQPKTLTHFFPQANEITFDLFPFPPSVSDSRHVIALFLFHPDVESPPVFSYSYLTLMQITVRKTRAKWRQPTAVMHTCEPGTRARIFKQLKSRGEKK